MNYADLETCPTITSFFLSILSFVDPSREKKASSNTQKRVIEGEEVFFMIFLLYLCTQDYKN